MQTGIVFFDYTDRKVVTVPEGFQQQDAQGVLSITLLTIIVVVVDV